MVVTKVGKGLDTMHEKAAERTNCSKKRKKKTSDEDGIEESGGNGEEEDVEEDGSNKEAVGSKEEVAADASATTIKGASAAKDFILHLLWQRVLLLETLLTDASFS
jgi:hypothetical protein